MIVCKVTPLKDFDYQGEAYKKGCAAYIDERTATRWARDGFAKKGASFAVEKLFKKNAQEE